MKSSMCCIAVGLATTSSAAGDLLTIAFNSLPGNRWRITANLDNPSSFPTANFSAVNAIDFRIDGLATFEAPVFENAFLPGVLPESDPLAAPFGGIDLDTGVVNWFVQAPTNIAPTSGSWIGNNHVIGDFTLQPGANLRVEIFNLSGAFENPADAVIGTASIDYVVAGEDTGNQFQVTIPAPATAGLLGVACLASVRRR